MQARRDGISFTSILSPPLMYSGPKITRCIMCLGQVFVPTLTRHRQLALTLLAGGVSSFPPAPLSPPTPQLQLSDLIISLGSNKLHVHKLLLYNCTARGYKHKTIDANEGVRGTHSGTGPEGHDLCGFDTAKFYDFSIKYGNLEVLLVRETKLFRFDSE